MIVDLSQEEAQKLLGEKKIARLACVLGNGEPYVVPVNYFFKDGCVYIHSTFGLKVEALRANPKACVQVDEIKSTFNWRSVVAFGEFEEITGEKERAEILQEFLNHFQNLTPVESMNHSRVKSEETVLFRIRLGFVTGRAES